MIPRAEAVYTFKFEKDSELKESSGGHKLLDQLAEVRALLEKMDECIAELKRRMSENRE